MSALAGLWRLDGAPGADDACARMLTAQAVYGPHVASRWDGHDVALGRRLFRCLPEDRHDLGVLTLGDGARMAADVRLDNRSDLARDLGLEPGRAMGMADASILAAAWSRWGEGCFDRLVGDYAFAVWDGRRRRLVLARDPFGHRPLHFHRSARLVAFASMPRGLHALQEIPVSTDQARLAAFLALRPETGSGTFFEAVERVEPGGMVVINQASCAASRHYSPRLRSTRLSGPAEYAEAMREQLDLAVAAQLRGAEHGVAAHLSSGWDSAAVAATAARQMESRRGRVTAFTAAPRSGFDGEAPIGRHGDESLGAAEVAALYPNMDHVVIRGTGRSPLEDLDGDIAFCGRPILNPCNHVWFNDINRAAQARGLTVLLTGDFGNLGLTDDGLDALPDLAASGDWPGWFRLSAAAARTGAARWRGILAASFEARLPASVATRLRRALGRPIADPADHSALHPDLWGTLGRVQEHSAESRVDRRLGALTRMDLALYTKGALARFGVDVRDPLTDRRLFEFCLSVPVEHLAADGRIRGLARRVLSDRLPASMLDRRTRGYQAVDWHEGLSADRTTVVADIDRLAALPAAAGLLDIERLRNLACRWPQGGWERDEVLDAYRVTLLRALAVGRFLTHAARANG